MEEQTSFFHTPLISTSLRQIEDLLTSGSQPRIANPLYSLLTIVIRELQTVKESDKEAFPHAISHFRHELENTLPTISEKSLSDQTAIRLLAIFFYFALEREFQLNVRSNAVTEINRNLDKLHDGERDTLIRINQTVGADILKYYLNHSDFRTIREILELNTTAKKERDAWDENFKKQMEAINENKQYLENMRTNSGFVALKFGFQRLLDSKTEEATRSSHYLVLFGAALLIVPFVEILYFMSKGFSINTEPTTLVGILLPAITIQLLLVYFFRINLITYKSLRAQQLQIDLRVSICQFFESYAEFVSKNEKLQRSVSKFENMMFSSIVASETAIPSVFDGTEQIIKIFDALKKSP